MCSSGAPSRSHAQHKNNLGRCPLRRPRGAARGGRRSRLLACCCCPTGMFLRAGLSLIQRVVARGAAAARDFFLARGPVWVSARCCVRCCCSAPGVLLRTGRLVTQRVVARGAAAARAVFRRAGLCVFQRVAACSAAVVRQVCYARGDLFFLRRRLRTARQ